MMKLRLAAAAILAAIACGAAVIGARLASIDMGILGVLFAGGASAMAVSGSRSARRDGWVLPLTFIGLWTLGFGLATLAWRHPTNELFGETLGLRRENLAPGLAVASMGILIWAAGYCLLRFLLLRTLLSSLRRWSTAAASDIGEVDYSILRITLVYGLGFGARLGLLVTGRYSYITSDLQAAISQSSPLTAMLRHVEFLTTIGLLLLAYASFRSNSRAATRLLLVALMLEVPFGLLAGMRSFILLRILGVALTYFALRRRVPVVAALALLAAISITTPFTDAYRAEVRDSTGTTVTAVGAARLIPELMDSTLREISLRDALWGPSTFVTGRLRFVDDVAMVRQRSPSEIPYIPPSQTMLEAVTVIVPRALWSAKPVYTIGLEYARDFWNQPQSLVSARSPGYPGEAFLRGGWGGVVVLMAMLGGLMAAVNSAFSPLRYPSATPVFVVAWTVLLNIEGPLVLLGAGLMQSLLITTVTMRLCRQPRERRRPVEGVHRAARSRSTVPDKRAVRDKAW